MTDHHPDELELSRKVEEVVDLVERPAPVERDHWPVLRPEALYGLAGEVVGTIAPHTEADRAALLVTFLVLAGNEVGPETYVRIGQVRHPPRLFAVLVGESAVARKGTSFADVRSLFHVEDDPGEYRVLKGSGSGEGLITALAERIGSLRRDDDPDAPPRDPRMVVVESEFTSVLRVAARDGSTLSHVLRDAWDGTTLQNHTKSLRIRVPAGSMVGLIGHVTADELRAELTRTDAASGFGNRFLLAAVRRARSLPLPISLDLRELGTDVRAAAMAGSRSGALRWSDEAEALWSEVYAAHLADVDSLGGIAAPMVARGDAQMIRLIATYAALDGAGVIRPDHVEAARAVWDYCRASTLRVFGDATGDPIADRIANAVEDTPEGMGRREIHELLGRNYSALRVDVAVASLVRSGRFEEVEVATAGRPRTVLIAVRTNEVNERREP